MEKLFGIPIAQFLLALAIVFAIIMGVMAVLAWRNRVFLKMAARNITRRPVQTALILVGLMLASLLFSASFSTGDTLTHSIRTEAIERLGLLDIAVRSEADDVTGRRQYFDEAYFDQIRSGLAGLDSVDGVAPYIVEQAPALAPGTRLSEPQVGILGVDPRMEGFGALKTSGGQELSVLDLEDSDVYISTQASEKLGVAAGDSLALFFGPVPTTVQVKGVYDSGSILGGDVTAVLPLSRVQALTNNAGEINRVLVSNTGGLLDGADKTGQVLAMLEPMLDGTGLEANPIKQDTIATADQAGSIFSSIFILFGQFSIAAGILLIFLIFVMLAAERRRELGIARAVGTQQSHVVLLFTLEGGMYALLAGLVGAFLGILVGWGMVGIMTTAFGEGSFRLVHTFRFQSVAMAYVLGVVLTFIVVVISAWRVSRTNVVRAIRDIPEPRLERRSRRSLLLALALPILGLAIMLGGIQAKQWGSYLLGTSMIIIGIPLLARRLGWLPDRIAYTLASILLLAWWFIPGSVHEAMIPATEEFQQGIELFFLSGIMVVLAGVWLVVYNAHLLLNAIVFVIGRVRGLPPILKTAISYPMEHRFRTGMTLAMFSLVVFTLIVMAFILNASAGVLSDPEKLSGGFEIRTDVSYANPIPDISEALSRSDGVSSDEFDAIASFAVMPIQVRQEGSAQDWSDMVITGADSGYTDHVNYDMATNVDGYGTPREIWQALQSEPNTVIVSPFLVPMRTNYNFGAPATFQLEGFYADDKPMPEVYLEVKNTFSGAITRLKVIGVMEQGAYYGQIMVTGKTTLDSLVGQPLPPRSFWFDTKPGVDVSATAKALEASFLENGLQAEVMAEEIEQGARTQLMVNNLLQGFMGLGLVVGIAALGVIAARSVVERRREIGMVRAIGFQRTMVQASFLIESSFVALLGIGIGVALGMGLSVQILDEMKAAFPTLQYQVPVANVVIVILIAYFASLLTTFLPSVQASRIYPAEALRYE